MEDRGRPRRTGGSAAAFAAPVRPHATRHRGARPRWRTPSSWGGSGTRPRAGARAAAGRHGSVRRRGQPSRRQAQTAVEICRRHGLAQSLWKIAPRDHHQVAGLQLLLSGSKPLADHPLDPIPSDCLAHLSRHGDAEAHRIALRAIQPEYQEVVCIYATAVPSHALEISSPQRGPQPAAGRWPGGPGRHGQRRTLLPLDRRRQPGTPLGTPPGQDLAPACGLHARAEPVGTGATDSAGLIGPLHGRGLVREEVSS